MIFTVQAIYRAMRYYAMHAMRAVGRLVVHRPVITRPRVLSPTLYVPEATTTRVD